MVQVHAVSTSPAYQSSMMRPDVAARLQAQMSLNRQELAAARWMFGLLDLDNDGEPPGTGLGAVGSLVEDDRGGSRGTTMTSSLGLVTGAPLAPTDSIQWWIPHCAMVDHPLHCYLS
jgi:hypothetical protein